MTQEGSKMFKKVQGVSRSVKKVQEEAGLSRFKMVHECSIMSNKVQEALRRFRKMDNG